ncbi:MAG: WYL domain-containing transcriptional regulator [Mariprofundales bacterium]
MKVFAQLSCLHEIFKARRCPVSIHSLCDELECAPATVKRRIRELREWYGAPIFNVRGEGWRYDHHCAFELPGICFNRQELEILLAMERLLTEVGPGMLGQELAPVRARLQHLLENLSPHTAHETGRIRRLVMGRRLHPLPHFQLLVSALLERKRLRFHYHSRTTGQAIPREVSPQRMIHYRDNWYLDGWCHLRERLRTFALEQMADVQRLAIPAVNIDEAELQCKLGSAYGIFSGVANKVAVLRFTATSARWVADEQWHPDQEGTLLDDGRYQLRIPYADATELIMDICRHGDGVEVVAPTDLRTAVAKRLRLAAAQYR